MKRTITQADTRSSYEIRFRSEARRSAGSERRPFEPRRAEPLLLLLFYRPLIKVTPSRSVELGHFLRAAFLDTLNFAFLRIVSVRDGCATDVYVYAIHSCFLVSLMECGLDYFEHRVATFMQRRKNIPLCHIMSETVAASLFQRH